MNPDVQPVQRVTKGKRNMAHINKKRAVATLTLAESMLWASNHMPDGRELSRVMCDVRQQVRDAVAEIGRDIEIYACKRHGGHVVDVVTTGEL